MLWPSSSSSFRYVFKIQSTEPLINPAPGQNHPATQYLGKEISQKSWVFFTTLILLDSNWEIPLLLNEAEIPLLVKYKSMIGLIASSILSVAVMQCADSNIQYIFGDKSKHSTLPVTIFIKDAWYYNWELSLYLSSLTMSVSKYSWVLIIYVEEHFRSDPVVQHLYSLKGQSND